jgi:hypothetical protein
MPKARLTPTVQVLDFGFWIDNFILRSKILNQKLDAILICALSVLILCLVRSTCPRNPTGNASAAWCVSMVGKPDRKRIRCLVRFHGRETRPETHPLLGAFPWSGNPTGNASAFYVGELGRARIAAPLR